MKSHRGIAGLAFALLVGSVPARPDIVREINQARAEGCGGRSGIRQPLRSSAELGAAARRIARGESLRRAMDEAEYRSIKSSSIHLSGRLTDQVVALNLRNRFCNLLVDAQLREIGSYRKGNDIWLVLAQPFSSLALNDPAAVSRKVLQLVNEARSQARRCGHASFAPAPPLRLSAALYRAALEHSRDMARHDYFEHEARDGRTPGQRVTAQGYRWRVTGENLAAGVTTPQQAVEGWLESPHHCANLMDPRFTEMGVAYAVDPASRQGIYWTQEFALPR